MIDQGNLTGARSALESIIARPDALETERAEAVGLLGRIFKQLYVNANDPKSLRQRRNLRQAIDKYYGVYRISPRDYLWQGINTVALLHRARRDEVEVAGVPGADVLANEIAAILRTLPKLNYWDRATAIENCVALGRYEDANMHVLHYAEDPGVDGFEIGSLQRQLLEVWQLTKDREPGGTLLPVLESALLKRAGGCLVIDSRSMQTAASQVDQARVQFERVFGTDRYQPLGWLKIGLKRVDRRDDSAVSEQSFLPLGSEVPVVIEALVTKSERQRFSAGLALSRSLLSR